MRNMEKEIERRAVTFSDGKALTSTPWTDEAGIPSHSTQPKLPSKPSKVSRYAQ
jgi:hypothetical protein